MLLLARLVGCCYTDDAAVAAPASPKARFAAICGRGGSAVTREERNAAAQEYLQRSISAAERERVAMMEAPAATTSAATTTQMDAHAEERLNHELAVAAEGGEIEGEDAPPEATAEGDEIEGEDAEDAKEAKKRKATLAALGGSSSEEEELAEEVWEAQEELRKKEDVLHSRHSAQQAAGALDVLADRTVERELQEDTTGKRQRRRRRRQPQHLAQPPQPQPPRAHHGQRWQTEETVAALEAAAWAEMQAYVEPQAPSPSPPAQSSSGFGRRGGGVSPGEARKARERKVARRVARASTALFPKRDAAAAAAKATGGRVVGGVANAAFAGGDTVAVDEWRPGSCCARVAMHNLIG